ncbi:GlcNAc-transferase family protein [Intestinirhabdus alba]|uniref:Glycosyltransferase n=1 Tax=Intestinirhabdus alba TaxID=2899544 RepID=A0A6L6IIK7_9ENTR|nr:GlcNAc-transferase family protein [Intestinirhabdus alba]MTH46692.1 glycosyltransferase [Intestinirhabdus alba]
MDNPATIFITIASYRDPQLVPTLRDMLQHAACPQNLHIAVCWQDHEDLSLFAMAGFTPMGEKTVADRSVHLFRYRHAHIKVISVHYFASQGACWARSQAEALYDNERYFLQIDSHCRFVAGWDREMIAMLEQLRTRSSRPLITAYPPAFVPGENEEASKKRYVSRLIFREFDDQRLPMLTSTSFESSEPVPGSYLAGGFIFTDGDFVQRVPNDPQIFFAGEEIAMAVRAFTHGYDVFHPHKPLLWHYYQRQGQNKIWGDHTNEANSQGLVEKAWWQRDNQSKARVRALLGIGAEPEGGLAPWSLGDRRSLREFEYRAGIHLQNSTVLPEVIGPDKINFFAPPADEAAWLERHRAHHRKVITLSESDYLHREDETDTLHVSVYNQQNILMHKFTLKHDELAALPASQSEEGRALTIEFKTASASAPATIRLCPWSSTAGWGDVRESAW